MSDLSWLDAVHFDDRGLVTAIAQDFQSGAVLMLAWMNREALIETAQTGRAVYFSRSRGRLWRKGEESGNVQRIHAIELDCDGDAVLLKVEQLGGIACHTGRAHCFFNRLLIPAGEGGAVATWQITEPVLKDPATMYGKSE